MKRPIGIIAIVFVLIAGAVAAGWLYFRANPQAWEDFQAEMRGQEVMDRAPITAERPAAREGELLLSGTIEAQQVTIASELGGRVVELSVSEGQAVRTGDALLRLDPSALRVERAGAQAGLAQAEAAVEAAQAQLALAQRGARPEEIAVAEGGLALAQAGLAAAQAQVDAAEGQLVAAQAGLAAAEAQLDAASAALVAAEADLEVAQAAQTMVDQAEAGVDAAQAQVDAAEAGVDAAQAVIQMAEAGQAGAQAGATAARAQVDQAQATLGLLRAGARPEEIAALEANLAQAAALRDAAQAAVQAINLQLERTALTAPMDGVVVQQLVQPGELAAPGAPLLTLADLDPVTLTVFVPEADLGQVSLGQAVQVTVDAYQETFTGHVSLIASQAEFTPRNIQTPEERVHMVFAVKIRLDNADYRLKPGMPADARFGP